ncbi:MAG: AAA family ATPase [Candidatus Didemnitutus sp.]|nr:AAA family ATPase [Candidatus Didemnitutus sp.]
MAASPPASLTGVLERIIFFNEENHYTIAELRPEGAKSAGARVTIVGDMPGVQCGETLRLEGEWTRHAEHGAQFKVSFCQSELPSSVYGIRKYLGSGLVPGIGKVYANKIVDAFETDTFRVLSEESGRLRKVPGIGKVRAAAIKSAWEEQKTLREVHIYLQTYGVTTSQCVRIVNKFGPPAKEIITNEPYRIAREIDGIGFKTADQIARNLGYANDAAPRLDAGLIYALETLQEEGHTAYPRDELVTYTATLLETSAERVESRIDALVAAVAIISQGEGKGAFLQLPINARAEQRIAGVVRRLDSVPTGLPPIKIDAAITWAQERAGIAFHPLQQSSLKNALTHKFSILTGGPGTGKAQPLHALVLTPAGFRAIGELRPGDKIVTPEGKTAAVRSIHPQGIKPVYRVHFSDGRSCECCSDHLWKVWTRTSVWSPTKRKKIRSRGWRVVPLSYVQQRLLEHRTESERMGVPLLTPCASLPDIALPCDPYVLGALIGDGNLGSAVLLTTTDAPLRERIAALVAPLGVRLKPVTLRGEETITCRLIARGKGRPNPLRDAITQLGLTVNSEAKFIPELFFNGSAAQRLELLRGLLDTDGTVDKLGVVSFTSCSFRLAKDCQRLAWSLGCIATLGAPKKTTFTYRGVKKAGRDAYTIFIQHPDPATLFFLPRKKQRVHRLHPRKRFGHRVRITSIQPLAEQECVCLSVDSASGLYLTNDYVVTHNTTILRALVEILKAKKARVTLAAPTGRAAQRLASTTGGFASTIHRLLKFENGSFTVNESRPLATDFLIVDEASMLDVRLAAALLQAVPNRAHLLLVGDIDQLPSVGAGNVLKDLIATEQIPVTRLSFVYRQQKESLIVTTAHAINEGITSPPPVVPEVAKAQAWSDLNFIAAHSAEDCLAKIIELCTQFIPAHFKWFDPVADVQVLAPMHKGVAGVSNLNAQLQAALNPHPKGLRAISGEYRPGDKLIQLRNNYDKNLFNGDIGTIVSVDLTKGTLIADFDGDQHLFERGEFSEVALAYAISIHKCVAADTWILTSRGWRQIADLWPATGTGIRVRSLKIRLAGPAKLVRTDQIYRGETEQALRVTTRHGYTLTGSRRHPVQVLDPVTGKLIWKKLPELRSGDYLPIRREMMHFSARECPVRYRPTFHPRRRILSLPKSVNADLGLLLGYLVGDGSYDERKDGDVRLTNADRSLIRSYARILREQFGLRPTLSRSTARKTAPTWYVISKTFREWLSAAGLDYATARIKKVPDSVLQSTRAVQAAFLRGLFDTDGSASGNGTRVVLATTSSLLADQVRMMLLNFGIITARLHIKTSDSWRVEMYGANLRLFEQHIGFGLLAKARQLRRMAGRADGWNEKTNVDIVPGAARRWRELRDALKARLGPTKGRAGQGLFAKSFRPEGIMLSRLAIPSCQTNYRHLNELLSAIGNRWPWAKQIPAYQTLDALRCFRYFFDPIRAIQVTEAAMFDLHVPGTHAFITNGLISHNSQGSEYPVVIIPLLKGHFMMLQRNLVYTAITRGKKKVFIVGDPAAYGMAVRNAESKLRCTHLREKILSPAP